MHRLITSSILAVLLGGIVQTQPQFTMRAASSESVREWNRMTLNDGVVWVSPFASLTSLDIDHANGIIIQNGHRAVQIVLTDQGGEKMKKLSAAQNGQRIAMVLGDQLIWAPVVRSEIGKTILLTGDGPDGLSEELVQKLLASMR